MTVIIKCDFCKKEFEEKKLAWTMDGKRICGSGECGNKFIKENKKRK